jgi:hypothetical protein
MAGQLVEKGRELSGARLCRVRDALSRRLGCVWLSFLPVLKYSYWQLLLTWNLYRDFILCQGERHRFRGVDDREAGKHGVDRR